MHFYNFISNYKLTKIILLICLFNLAMDGAENTTISGLTYGDTSKWDENISAGMFNVGMFS